jgi:hypothetical protein
MMKIIVVISGLFVACSGFAASVYAGGRFFVGIGASPFIGRGSAGFLSTATQEINSFSTSVSIC